jgi:hypothetical protein
LSKFWFAKYNIKTYNTFKKVLYVFKKQHKTLTDMLNTDEFIAMIDAYLDNSLSETEKSVFEQTLQANPALKKEVAAQKLVRKALKRSGQAEMQQLFRQFQAEMQEEQLTQTTSTNVRNLHLEKRRRYAVMAIAASVVLFLGIGFAFFLQNNKNNNNVAQNVSAHKIEYIEKNSEAMGFAGTNAAGADYKTLLVTKSETYLKTHYEFIHRDTIMLFSNELNPAKDKLQLIFDSQNSQYSLRVNGNTYQIEQGFKGVKELK